MLVPPFERVAPILFGLSRRRRAGTYLQTFFNWAFFNWGALQNQLRVILPNRLNDFVRFRLSQFVSSMLVSGWPVSKDKLVYLTSNFSAHSAVRRDAKLFAGC